MSGSINDWLRFVWRPWLPNYVDYIGLHTDLIEDWPTFDAKIAQEIDKVEQFYRSQLGALRGARADKSQQPTHVELMKDCKTLLRFVQLNLVALLELSFLRYGAADAFEQLHDLISSKEFFVAKGLIKLMAKLDATAPAAPSAPSPVAATPLSSSLSASIVSDAVPLDDDMHERIRDFCDALLRLRIDERRSELKTMRALAHVCQYTVARSSLRHARPFASAPARASRSTGDGRPTATGNGHFVATLG